MDDLPRQLIASLPPLTLTRPAPVDRTASTTRGRRRASGTIVVGSPEFVTAVRAAGEDAGRQVHCYDHRTIAHDASLEIIVEGSRYGSVPADLLDGARSVIVVPPDEAAGVFKPVLPTLGRVTKRAIDVVVAGLLLLIMLPALLVMCIAIRVDSRGPAIFRQERIGQNGRRFVMWKLRTMYTDNDTTAHATYVEQLINGDATTESGIYKLVADPRITFVGRFLRKMSLDELPQLVNVLRGDMSLVGPRPPLEYETRLYDAVAWQRLRVAPGLTGPWQVSGRSALPFHRMVELDVEYWRQWRLRDDLRILLLTPAVVLSARGAA